MRASAGHRRPRRCDPSVRHRAGDPRGRGRLSRPEHVIVRGQAGCAASVAATIARPGRHGTRAPWASSTAPRPPSAVDRLSALRAAPCVASVTPRRDGEPQLDRRLRPHRRHRLALQHRADHRRPGRVDGRRHRAERRRRAHRHRCLAGAGPQHQRQGDQRARPLVRLADAGADATSTRYGHGTHMAGIIAGRDPANPPRWTTSATPTTSSAWRPTPTSSTSRSPTSRARWTSRRCSRRIDWVVQHRNTGNIEHPGHQPVVRHQQHPVVHARSARLRGRGGVEERHRGRGRAGNERLRRQRSQRPRVTTRSHRGRCGRHAGHAWPRPTTPSPPSPARQRHARP